MQVLPEALVAQARRRLGRAERSQALRLRSYPRGLSLATLSMVLGALAGSVYPKIILHRADWPMYVVGAVGGAAVCFLLIAIPRLTWLVLRRQWVKVALHLCREQQARLLAAAQNALKEAAAEPQAPPEIASDLAVVDCLRGRSDLAAEVLWRLYQERHSPTDTNNLLVALTETRRWEAVGRLLERELAEATHLTDASLAAVAADAPQEELLEKLWAHAQRADCPQTLNNLGVRFLRQGDLIRAEETLNLAIRGRPSYALAHANLGVLAYRREDYLQAVGELAGAATLEPSEGAICANLGAVLCQAGDPRAARRWLHRAQAVSPGNHEALANLGNALAMEGQYEEALAALSQAGRAGKLASAHHNAALILCANKHHDAALEAQRLALEAAPEDAEVLNNLGCFLWLRGAYAEAERHFGQAAEARYNETAKGNLIRADLAAGRPRRVLFLLAQAAYAEEDMDFDRGLAHLITAAQAPPERRPTGDALHDDNLTQAVKQFQRVINMGRDAVTEAYIDLGVAEYLGEQYEEAANAFAAAAERSPATEELHYLIATCYLIAAERLQARDADGLGPVPPRARELLRQAQPHLAKALGARSVAEVARLNLAVAHYLVGDYQQAIKVLRPAARPDSAWEVQNLLAIAQARQARELERVIQTSPLLGGMRKRQMKADITKLLSAAIHAFGQVLRRQPHDPVVHANVGLAYFLRNRAEDVEQALFHWQRMRQTGGEWGERIYQIFTVAMSSDSGRLKFQDIEVAFAPLPAREYITCAPPRLVGPQYVVRERPDMPPPPLQAHHPLLRRALACRDRAERLRRTLLRLAI